MRTSEPMAAASKEITAPTIVFIDHSPRIGGATRVLLTTLKVLDRQRFRAVVVCNAGTVADAFRAQGHEVVALDLPLLTFTSGLRAFWRTAVCFFRAAASIARIVRERQASAIYAHGLASALYAWRAAVFGRAALVWHVHEMPDARARMRPFVTFAAAAAREIVCVSRACAVRVQRLGAPAARCSVVYNAPPLELEGAADGPLAQGSGDGSPLLVSVGALTPAKGHAVLIEAMAVIVPRFPGTVAAIVGEPLLDEDVHHEQRLREQVRALGLGDHVRFLGFRSDVAEILRRATVVVHPSICEETFGLVPLEAMALGRPVVASRSGGIPEVISDGQTGVLVTPRDATELARAVCELLGDPARRERMGAAGRRRASDEFSMARMTAGLNAAFERAISRAPFVV